jgi:hypothetical protein
VDDTNAFEFVEKNWTAFVQPTEEPSVFVWTSDIVLLLSKKFHIECPISASQVNTLMKRVYQVKPQCIREMHVDSTLGKRKWGFMGYTMHRPGEPEAYF